MEKGDERAVGDAVLVGVDGSTGSVAALRFAASEAEMRKSRLKVLTVLEELVGSSEPDPTYLSGLAMMAAAPVAVWTEKIEPSQRVEAPPRIKGIVASALVPFPEVPYEIEAWEGRASSVLVAQSERVSLMVVGARGHGGFAGLRLGSVAEHVLHRASCSAVVVRPVWKVRRSSGTSLVEVAVDLSDGPRGRALATIRFALAEARLRQGALEVVGLQQTVESWRSELSSHTKVREAEESLVRFVADQADAAGIQVKACPAHGRPVGRLVEASKQADLLVIDAGMNGIDPGTVRSQVVHYARCPVALHRSQIGVALPGA